jgi:hypothetical protein
MAGLLVTLLIGTAAAADPPGKGPTTRAVVPATQPVEPASQPSTQPAEPSTQPVEPASQPATQPAEPSTQPVEPTSQPEHWPEIIPSTQPAISAAAGPPAPGRHLLLGYGHLGLLIPTAGPGANVAVRLGGGYAPRLPRVGQRLAALLDLSYGQMSDSVTRDDPRLGENGGSYQSEVLVQDLQLFLGALGFLYEPDQVRRWLPYAAFGLELHFVETTVDGTAAGQYLGLNSETSTQAGVALRGGVGYRLGPGMITGELDLSWANLDHRITGDSHLGRVLLLVGYTAMVRR